jgi:2',3'-cyclic-nucleotide 2'-phosphodiesterase (5'-nucleotidase family)
MKLIGLKMTTLATCIALTLTGCNGDDGDNGQTSLLSFEDVDPGDECVYGGTLVKAGIDTNGNNVLDNSEVTEENFICNTDALSEKPFTLQLLHTADMDGATGALENVKAFSANLDALKSQYPDNTLVLSSGDNYIPGSRYTAASDDSMILVPGVSVPGNGRGDIAFLNAMGFQASAVGNHDLDGGTEEFASIITAEGNYPGADFPYLSANLDFSTDTDLAELTTTDGQIARDISGKLAATTVIDVDGEKIGIVGATTPTLDTITSTGGITVHPSSGTNEDLAANIQAKVNELTATGINKVILLAHMQTISVEMALAPLLSDVDIIVAGGSNTLLADANDLLHAGDTAADTYPLEFTSASGEPVLVVNTDGDYKYLGRLVVEFDEDGVIDLTSLDDEVNGAYVSNFAMVSKLDGVTNTDVNSIADAMLDVIINRDSNILGNTTVYLDGRRSQVRTQETNLGNLTADANLALAQSYDSTVQISIKNGGGIRDDIGYFTYPPGSTGEADLTFYPPAENTVAGKEFGDISQYDIEGTLRFNNGLVLMDITAQQLYDVIEHAVAQVENTAGQFPQIAGIRFSFEPSNTAMVVDNNTGDITTQGTRVQNLAVVDSNGNVTDTVVQNGTLQGDSTRTFRIVTLDFMAGKYTGDGYEGPVGGDSYPWGFPLTNLVELKTALTDAGAASFADPGSEQDALAEYLLATYSGDDGDQFSDAETDIDQDSRIQNLSGRTDAVFP